MQEVGGTFSQSSGLADQRTVLGDAVRQVIQDVRLFGRIPKRKDGKTAEEMAENRLKKRWDRHNATIPADIQQELKSLEEKEEG